MAKVFKKYQPMLTQGFSNNHIGIDLVGNLNGQGALDNIICIEDGIVEQIEQNCNTIYNTQDSAIRDYGHSYGCYVLINHGNNIKTRYAHLQYKSNYHLNVGQKVKKGDLIGYMGSTGYTLGAHLHFELIKDNIPVDPYNLIFNNKQLINYNLELPKIVIRDNKENQFEVTVSDLNIRREPTTDSDVIYFPCPKGIYNILDISNDWYKIKENMWINKIGGVFYPKNDVNLVKKLLIKTIVFIKGIISKIIARFNK